MSLATEVLELLSDTDEFELLELSPAKNQEEIDQRLQVLRDSGVNSAVSGSTPGTDIKVAAGHGVKAVKILQKNQVEAKLR